MKLTDILRDIISKIIPSCGGAHEIVITDNPVLKIDCHGGIQEVYQCAKCRKWHVWE